ncbi:hypothetical protein [Oricola sp.]|uniref:hypothetical protein n=1 Tax=Oricola sp. TaxID=1979950 RepID=UPI0025DA8B84|nr:hypothetical protein [Oricola sp.]MCI5075622.1 hypothetical protein [Oricola sp.]
MTTWLVAVHILVTADTPKPRADIAKVLEAHLDGSAPSPNQPKAAIVDWAVAGEDLAASMAPAAVSRDYAPGCMPFPQWPVGKG